MTTVRPNPVLQPPRPVKAPISGATPPAKAPTSGAAAVLDQYFQAPRQKRYDLVADLVGSRIYVVDKATGKPVDRYLTSPGTAKYPTQGDRFTIRRALVKAPWIPPQSDWAKTAKVTPGGINNPMGIFKMDLGGYSQYIHGIPQGERKDLGKPASHGCLRMSNENVLQLFERYAGVGTEVRLNRDPAESARLKAAFAAQGLKDHPITDGKELLPGAIAGKAPTPVG